MNKQLRVQPSHEVSADRREKLLATVTAYDELGSAIEFGIVLNRCFFYSTQHWIACTPVSYDRAGSAWLDLRLQSQKLPAAPLAANAISKAVQALEDEFARTLERSWYRDSRVDLLNELHQLPDDEYYEDAEDNRFAAYLSPIGAWKTSLCKLVEELLSTQLRSVLLGDWLGSYVLGDRVWKAMYLAESTREQAPAPVVNTGDARPIDPAIFNTGPRTPLDEIFWVRRDLPSTVVDSWPLHVDDREMILLQQRISNLGLSWETAKSALFGLECDANKPSEWSLPRFLTEQSLTRFIQMVRAAALPRNPVDVANYLGIIVEDFTVFYQDQKAPLGNSRKLEKLAKAYVEAGETGLSREDLERLQKPGTNPSNVDGENGKLKERLERIGLTVDSERTRGKAGRFVLRPLLINAKS